MSELSDGQLRCVYHHDPLQRDARNLLATQSMKSYLAAAIQMTSVPNLAKNLAQAEELIDLAVRQGAQLVSLPE
ncbi:MAG: nitrilase-related carbon-nitrogen hydrolase, partial [Geitlerinemataceae cyanobacterium]